jgi:hypothetical protein
MRRAGNENLGTAVYICIQKDENQLKE